MALSALAGRPRVNWAMALAAGAWAFIAAGCMTMRPTDPYAPMPRALEVAGAQGEAPARGTRVSNGPLTLAQCVAIALANNPEVAARERAVETATAERDLAAAERWPSVHALAGYQHHINDQRVLPPTKAMEEGAYSDDLLAADLVVTMPLYTGGRLTNEMLAAELLRRAAGHRLARTRRELVFDVSSTFFSILGQRRVIESLEFSRKALEEHRRRVQNLLAVQKAARVDLLRTEVRLADLAQRLVRERNILAIEHRVLANLMGLKQPVGQVAISGKLELVPIEADVARSVAKALGQRADYLAARAALEAQAKRVDAARGERLPSVSAVGSYGLRAGAHWLVPQTSRDERGDVGYLGVEVDVPVFESGRIDARVRRERARMAEVQEVVRAQELRVRLDVERAVLNVNSARERILATEKAIEEAKESLRIEREKYELGRGSITDVLDAQSALLDAQTAYYRALADYNTAVAELRLAVGEP